MSGAGIRRLDKYTRSSRSPHSTRSIGACIAETMGNLVLSMSKYLDLAERI